MEVMSGRFGAAAASTLNPNAAPFVPVAYRAVEDFSQEWWQLVRTAPWFRDYWLRECFSEPEAEDGGVDVLDLDNYEPALPDADADALFHSYPPQQEAEEKGRGAWEMMTWGADKWMSARGRSDGLKCFEKAPKIVSVKMSPRMIQQPR